MIEIEKRGLLIKEKYDELLAFLNEHAKSLGEDDKDVVYYIYDDKLLKVVNNLSKGNAKVSLKMNKLGDGIATKEIDVLFDQKDFSSIKEIFDTTSQAKQIIEGNQKRKNFMYKECEIAVKWSKDYGYHFEIEKVTDDEKNIDVLEKEINSVIDELDLISMTNDEIKEFQRKIEESAKK
jgi:adenylate cyclase class IV